MICWPFDTKEEHVRRESDDLEELTNFLNPEFRKIGIILEHSLEASQISQPSESAHRYFPNTFSSSFCLAGATPVRL